MEEFRATKLRRETALRAVAKRLAQAAASHQIEVAVQRQDLELLLAVFTEKRDLTNA